MLLTAQGPCCPVPPALHMGWPLCWNPAFSMGFAFKPEPGLLSKFMLSLTRRLLVAIAVICKLETDLCYRPVFAAQTATWKYNFLFVFRPRYHNTIPTAKKWWNYHQLWLPAANFLHRLNRSLKRSLQMGILCICTIYIAEMLMTVEIWALECYSVFHSQSKLN